MNVDVRVGDEAATYGGAPRSAGVSGRVVKLGRTNVTIETQTRFAPGGPIFTHVHKVGKHEITAVVRDGVVVYIDERFPKHRGQLRIGDRVPEAT